MTSARPIVMDGVAYMVEGGNGDQTLRCSTL